MDCGEGLSRAATPTDIESTHLIYHNGYWAPIGEQRGGPAST